MSEKEIKQAFIKLQDDQNFKITSKRDQKYNCIAWAAFISDRWVWPYPIVDGVYWPDDVPREESIDAFIKMYQTYGYEVCELDDIQEDNYRKIALYKNSKGNCTHASRQLRSGFWTSKLGQSEDIQHGTPFTIESPFYGEVAVIMKKKI